MKKIKWIIASFVLISIIIAGILLLNRQSTDLGNVSVVYINAGKADSILIKIQDKSYLIDTGTSHSAKKIKKVLKKYRVSTLDGVFLTHTHKDHIGGFKKIVKSYSVKKLYAADISKNDENGDNPIEMLAQETNFTLNRLSAGDKLSIAKDVNMEVLGPIEYNDEDDNDNSLVMKMRVNGKTFLFCGDMKHSEENTLLKASVDVKADIIKVGHHGRKDATSEEFAKAVSPEYAVICTDSDADKTASKSVRRMFTNVYITDEYKYGILFTVASNGKLTIKNG